MERVLKYQAIENYMLQELSSGRLVEGDRFFSEADIAKQFNVTELTARKAFAQLENKGYITRRRGLGTFVKALPERPQRLKIIKRCILGIVIGDSEFDNSLKLGRMVIALHRAIEQAGYLAMLAGDDPAALLETEVNGVVVIDRIKPDRLRKLVHAGVPLVGIHSSHDAMPSVCFDYTDAARRIVDCFRNCGARSMAMVGEGEDALMVRNLFEREIAANAGKADMSLAIAVPPLGSAREEFARLLDSPQRPDAIFAMNAWSLGTIAELLRARKLEMGRDISVLVNGSNALLIPGTPGYSIIDIDVEQAAHNSIALLQQLIRDPQSKVMQIVSPYGEIIDCGSLVHPKTAQSF